jgi:hypothetical protein
MRPLSELEGNEASYAAREALSSPDCRPDGTLLGCRLNSREDWRMRKADRTSGEASRKRAPSRRTLLVGVAAGLGASILVQPNGGVALAKSSSPASAAMRKGGKKKEESVKKEGG